MVHIFVLVRVGGGKGTWIAASMRLELELLRVFKFMMVKMLRLALHRSGHEVHQDPPPLKTLRTQGRIQGG